MSWIKCLCIFLLFTLSAFSQNETQKWYFGYQCGLDFSSSPPTVIPSPVFNSMEGGACISDASGNLLFYTDGVTVWNATHAVMANGNGLLGHQSSTQSSIIVQQPGSTSVYYLFTQEERGLPNGFRYSIIDMSLSGGLGAVTTKNVLLHTPSCEKLAAVKHCNGNDVWIVTHDFNSDVFRSLLLTSTGLSSTPVLSAVGPTLSMGRYSAVLKISPNGKKIALPSFTNKLDLFDFNTGTGIVSNYFPLANIASYGCEFSPDGSKLYAGVDNIYQWDLCAGSNTAIQSSSVTIFLNSLISMSSFQLGPDAKIYIGMLQQNSLAVINNPNLSGVACNFISAGVSVGTGTCTLGLPNFMVSYFKPSATVTFSSTQNCSAISFTAPAVINNGCAASRSFTSTSWLFSDPASGAANSSTLSMVTHTFSSAGNYNVKLVIHYDCGTDTLSQAFTISTASVVVSSTSLCAGGATTLQASGADTYSWSSGATTSSIVVSPSTTSSYTLSGFYSNGCKASSTATVSVVQVSSPIVDFIYKTPLCTNDTNALPEIAGNFNFGGTFFSSPGLDLNDSTGRIDPTASEAGTFLITYSIQAKECVSSASKTASVVINEAPSLTLSPGKSIGPGQSTVLEVQGGSSYSWSPRTNISCTDCSNPTVSPNITTAYCVLSSETGCFNKACVTVEVSCDGGNFSFPNAFTPNGDGRNDSFCLQGWDLCVKDFSIMIFNRWGDKVFESTDPSFCWDGYFKGSLLDTEVFIYTVTASYLDGLQVSKKGNISLLR